MTASDPGVADVASGPWHLRTIHGHSVDEVVSALQKAIRRGQSDEAMPEHHVPIDGDRWRHRFYDEWSPGDPSKRTLE